MANLCVVCWKWLVSSTLHQNLQSLLLPGKKCHISVKKNPCILSLSKKTFISWKCVEITRTSTVQIKSCDNATLTGVTRFLPNNNNAFLCINNFGGGIYTQTFADEKYCSSLMSDFKLIWNPPAWICHWQNILYLYVFLSQNINIKAVYQSNSIRNIDKLQQQPQNKVK